MLTPDGTIATWNVGAQRLKGYTEDEAIGQHFSIFYTDEQRATGHPAHELAVATATGRYEEEAWRVRKDGTLFWASVIITAIYRDGILSGFGKVTRDMTEQRRLESAVERARDSAIEAALSRQEFLATMSHEMRTPMNAVIGMTSLLLDTNLDADQREYAEIVRSSGDHLLAVINDILDFSKIDAGKLVLEEMPFGVRAWAHDSVDIVALAAHEKGIEVVCDVASSVPAVLVGDPGRLRQVLLNLLSNAVKFTDSGEVVVRIDCDVDTGEDTTVRVAVTDTGIGIEGQTDSLFDPFTQVDSTTTRLYGGTGLGLAISRRLVEHMGGSLHLISSLGEGTTAEFTFRGGPSDESPRHQPGRLRGCRALIVDDNATNRRLLESWLTDEEMTFVSVASGAEALAAIADDHAFEFALLDLMMPVMDGAELGTRIRSQRSEIKLVLLSSAGPTAHDIAGRDAFDAHVTKPIRQDVLLDLMARLRLAGQTVERVPDVSSVFELRGGVDRNLSILIVDDSIVNQRVAQKVLSRFGFGSDVATSGAEAIAAVERHQYDLVLMDVQMPEMDGLAATREIRRRWPLRHMRILAMTANVGPEDVRECREAGMDAFLGKPIVIEALRAELLSLIRPDA